MRIHIALFALLIPSLAWAGNTCTTTSTGSNWSSSAHWTSCGSTIPGNGDTAVIANNTTVDVNTTVGASGAAATVAITINSGITLTIANGVTLKSRGDIQNKNGTLAGGAGSVLDLDGSVSTVAYNYLGGTGYGQPNTLLETTGTSAGNVFTIRSDAGGPNGSIKQSGDDSNRIVLNYFALINLGTSSTQAMNAGTEASDEHVVYTLTNGTLTNCGEVYFGVSYPDDGWNISGVNFTTTTAAVPLGLTGPSSPTGTRTISNSIFDKPPAFRMDGGVLTGNYFDQGWTDNSVQALATISGNFIRDTGGVSINGQTYLGSMSNSYVLADYWPTATVTGTATSATSTTLVDTSKSWTANAYAASTSGGWMVLITGGTGVNQLRQIASNTGNTLTLYAGVPWTTTPDSTSTYAIYDGIGNLHALGPNASGTTQSGNILDFTGAFNSGKFFVNSAIGAGAITLSNNITLPNGAGDTGGILYTFGTTTGGAITTLHNTVFEGALATYIDDYTMAAGTLASFKNNLFWAKYGGPTGTLGPGKMVDVTINKRRHIELWNPGQLELQRLLELHRNGIQRQRLWD